MEEQIKAIYSAYHSHEINADEALAQLEQLLNEGN
jgi:hypothetical protein